MSRSVASAISQSAGGAEMAPICHALFSLIRYLPQILGSSPYKPLALKRRWIFIVVQQFTLLVVSVWACSSYIHRRVKLYTTKSVALVTYHIKRRHQYVKTTKQNVEQVNKLLVGKYVVVDCDSLLPLSLWNCVSLPVLKPLSARYLISVGRYPMQ